MEQIPNDSTYVRDLTLGQLKVALFGPTPLVDGKTAPTPFLKPKRYIYGIRGIEDYFHVSHKTAQAYKNTFLKPAVNQNGRIICIDADLAMQLFNENEAKKNGK